MKHTQTITKKVAPASCTSCDGMVYAGIAVAAGLVGYGIYATVDYFTGTNYASSKGPAASKDYDHGCNNC